MPRPPAEDPSGVLVYPKIERPRELRAESAHPHHSHPKFPSASRRRALWIASVVVAGAAGTALGYGLKASHDGELAAANASLADRDAALAKEHARGDALSAQLDQMTAKKDAAEKIAAQLTAKSSDVDKKAADLAAAQQKVQAAVDASSGSVDTEGDEIHLRLVDKVLFATGDDQLTDKGKAVLDKVALALADLPDKQIWVQGHTDDQPIFLKKDPKAKAPPAGTSGKPAPQKFVTNWELSAGRALQVVHYLQDTAKIDPTRLAALAFGQYRPVSKTNKALNRRIEIVLYPKREILEKKKP